MAPIFKKIAEGAWAICSYLSPLLRDADLALHPGV